MADETPLDRFRSVLTEYQKAPQVTRDRMYLDTMQQIFGNVTKVLVDSKHGSGLLYMPLDKIIQSAASPVEVPLVAGSSPTPAPLANPAATAAPDARTRDTARSRDRDVR